jgi:outer membrane protein assembly factor BamB
VTHLRLWPGVIAAILLVVARFVVPLVVPGGAGIGLIGSLVMALAIAVWWLFFSRARWVERLGAFVLIAAAMAATRPLLHLSVAGAGMGIMFYVLAIPMALVALVAGVAAARHLSDSARAVMTTLMIVLACGAFTLVRTEGVTGEGESQFHWRWTPTPEDRLLAGAPPAPDAPVVPPAPPILEGPRPADAAALPTAPTPALPDSGTSALPPSSTTPTAASVRAAAWPGFRGPSRDSVIRGVRINTDWHATPPVEVWRKAIGPGWSSFAVEGDRIYTQEQRGEHELVSCYRLRTGAPVWVHRDAARFYESNGGAGPRATPTLHEGRVYAVGATGIVNALDADTGAVVWSRNGAADTGATLPGWGFAGSPIAIDGLVVAALSGRLVGYDRGTGSPRWVRQTRGGGYSSPHAATIDGVAQVLLLSGGGVTSVAPADGAVLWEHAWEEGVNIIQPASAENGDVLLTAGDMMGGLGMRRLAVSRTADRWTIEERWTSRALKPYFNDFVVHEGHAYGFDGGILAAIDLNDGARKWKGGRYGHGQMLLLPDQDLLLVLSEEGELALVSAKPDRFTEVARVAALEGKTWNHPVLIGDLLLVRNGEEMAAFRLPVERR